MTQHCRRWGTLRVDTAADLRERGLEIAPGFNSLLVLRIEGEGMDAAKVGAQCRAAVTAEGFLPRAREGRDVSARVDAANLVVEGVGRLLHGRLVAVDPQQRPPAGDVLDQRVPEVARVHEHVGLAVGDRVEADLAVAEDE